MRPRTHMLGFLKALSVDIFTFVLNFLTFYLPLFQVHIDTLCVSISKRKIEQQIPKTKNSKPNKKQPKAKNKLPQNTKRN